MAAADVRTSGLCPRSCRHLLLVLVMLCRLPAGRGSGEQLCDWCPAELRNSSEVVKMCQASHQVLRGRCCLSREEDKDIIVGLDLWNCSLGPLDSELQNASAALTIDISGNPQLDLSITAFQGFTNLQYIALPSSPSCPGGNAYWESVQNETNRLVCQNQRSSCNSTGQMVFLCPENALCAPDGPGLFKCPCDENYHGYKCLREGTFPMIMFFGILGAVTFACSLLFWCSQRRKVKNS
ncbi:all-trans retinoic acid-induced differentiation factor [Ambystoma mexicanum]|uniref:all-trans retinoic acid-induced differentiation factor n=1 Tax=Ambystoma mexicanum TaxID=8296 RepID=UPI0037E86762